MKAPSSYREIKMSSRDWDLLSYIEEQGFVSWKQLRVKFFNKDSTCSRRLSKLRAFKYIDCKRLKDFFLNDNSYIFPHIMNVNLNPHQNIFFLDRKYSKVYGKSRQLYKSSMLLHQLILNDIRDFLEHEVIHKHLLNDPKIKILSAIEPGRNREIVPDLSLEYDKVKIAIELERTLKNDFKYSKRILYFSDSIYTHVVYYYTNESILNKLIKKIGYNSKFAFAHYKRPNELVNPVYGYMNLNEFIHRINRDHL